MAESPKRDLEARLADGAAIDAAIRRAVREAVRRHKLLGNPIAVWRDNRVCWLQPEEIEIPEEPPPGS
jgi:hypothetical protein